MKNNFATVLQVQDKKLLYILSGKRINGIAIQVILWWGVKKIHGKNNSLYWEKNEIRVGPFKRWYCISPYRIFEEAFYSAGKLDGPRRIWYNNCDQIAKEVYYINGKREGLCKIWSSRGEICEECFYKDDLLVNCDDQINVFERHGTLISWVLLEEI